MVAAFKPLIGRNFSFAQPYRLTSKQDFAYVFTKPTKVVRQHFLALCRANTFLHPRLGIIISKHKVKQAYKRVLLRRIIRESFRHHKDVVKGLDIIILMRSECSPLNKHIIRKMVDKLWPAIGIKLNI